MKYFARRVCRNGKQFNERSCRSICGTNNCARVDLVLRDDVQQSDGEDLQFDTENNKMIAKLERRASVPFDPPCAISALRDTIPA
jgi:hypothetical protein